MDNDKVTPDLFACQVDLPEIRKIGIEIVRSAELTSRFFRGWWAASYSLRDDLWARRLERAMR